MAASRHPNRKIKFLMKVANFVGSSVYGSSANSIWGPEEKETLELIQKTKIKGYWLNLAAGDGRYNSSLLERADRVLTSDIDPDSLKSLEKRTPKALKSKLETLVFDISKKFPLKNGFFDGIFCAGAFHLFEKKTLLKIFPEISRVLRKNGVFIFDLATDIKRELPNDELITTYSGPLFSTKEAREFLTKALKGYKLEVAFATVPEEIVNIGKLEYKFNCNFLLVKGTKE